MDDLYLINSSVTTIVNAPIERFEISAWCFMLHEDEGEGGTVTLFTKTPEGRRTSVCVDTIGGSLMVQSCVETLHCRDHRILESVTDIFALTGRKSAHVVWELSAQAIDAERCKFTKHVRSRATREFMVFLDRQGIPFDVFQRRPLPIACCKFEQL